jgi:hypothetical protein
VQVALELTGLTALVQHNVRLADKEDHFAKLIAELTGKRKRTEEDNEQIAHYEFLGGLYYDQDLGVHVPTRNIVRSIEDAGKITRQGTDVIRAVLFLEDRAKLEYDGPRLPEELWALPAFRFRASVGVQRSKVTRMRPIFRRWSLCAQADILTDVLDISAFRSIVEAAGRSAGLCDARKLGYGRFTATVVAETEKET